MRTNSLNESRFAQIHDVFLWKINCAKVIVAGSPLMISRTMPNYFLEGKSERDGCLVTDNIQV